MSKRQKAFELSRKATVVVIPDDIDDLSIVYQNGQDVSPDRVGEAKLMEPIRKALQARLDRMSQRIKDQANEANLRQAGKPRKSDSVENKSE